MAASLLRNQPSAFPQYFIVLSNNKQTLGLGHGQTNRVDALKFALKNKKEYFKNKNFVCASDGFFPFTDSLNLLKKNGCNVVAQPSGSINDKKIIAFAIKNNISLYFTKNRLFKHWIKRYAPKLLKNFNKKTSPNYIWKKKF